MNKKNTTTSQKTLPKKEVVQNYKLRLKQRRVSGTVNTSHQPFDDTTSYPSFSSLDELSTRDIPERRTPKTSLLNWKNLGVVITILLAIFAAIYRFAQLEKSVEHVSENLSKVEKKMTRIEDENKKDYQRLDEKFVNHILKQKK